MLLKKHHLEFPDYLGKDTVKKLLEVSNKIITELQAETIFGRQITTAQLSDLNSCLQRFEINTPARLRMFCAQICHESGNLKWMKELASGEAYEGRADLGNNQPGDGRKFRGAGVIQLTGRANFQAFCNYVKDPRIMEGCNYVSQVFPFTSAGFFWMRNHINKVIDNGGDIYRVTKIINGGQNGISDRIKHYQRVSKVIK